MPSEITLCAPAPAAFDASENRVDERRDRRAVRQNEQSAKQSHHQDYRNEDEFPACTDELPKLGEDRQHACSSKLIFHRAGQGTRRAAFYPVAFRGGIESERQRALAGKPHQQSDRRDNEKKQYSHDDRVHDPGQKKRQLRPETIKWREQ